MYLKHKREIKEKDWMVKRQVILCLLYLFLISIFIDPFRHELNVVKAAEQDSSITQAVSEADLIVLGRVIGIIDPKPHALTQKHLEAHWIHVEQTLKGNDETGQRLSARPKGLLWEDGESYVIFLKRMGGDWFEAIPQQLLEATEAHLAAVMEEVHTQGSGVSPRLVLWMKYTGGLTTGVLAEFYVSVEGHFEWKKRLQSHSNEEQQYETRSGRLSPDAIASLIRQIEQAGPSSAADDAGIVAFRWLDAREDTQSKAFVMPDHPSSTRLLETIETLARRHGQTL
ncbi:MAG: hypothetical protein L0Z68_04915 [Gammaproteobacteria bacterium]|nr:hypothetical protein [Gammaproteobacteria bacterium]